MDDIGNSTVHSFPIILRKKTKQLDSATSSERYSNVITTPGINDIGYHVSPMIIFHKRHFNSQMLLREAATRIGGANISDCFKKKSFVQYVKHFSTQGHPSKTSSILPIMKRTSPLIL